MTIPDDITFFSAVDRTREPDFFKRFLDEGNKLPGIIASKPIILAGLQLTRGKRCLMSVVGSATILSNSRDWWEAAGVWSALMSAKA
jgi:hypothetical protein